MKIATKIALGYGVLITLLLAMLAYQLAVIARTARRSEDLSTINFRAGVLALQLLRDLDQIEEFTQKFFVTADPDYGEQVAEVREAFSQVLQEIRSLRLSSEEAQGFERLEQDWNRFRAAASQHEQVAGSRNAPQLQAALSDELAQLGGMRLQTLAFLQATRDAIESQVAESSRASRRAQQVSWAAAVSALLLSLAVSFWIVRSISRPLGRLTEATRAVAAGQFSYRVHLDGKDELAQLATDFDTMTRRLNELDELKKDFLSHVSHELKSPLSSIQETARLLLEEIPGRLAPQQRRFLELSLQSGRRLSSMIGSLLDLSRIEAGVMEYQMQPHDLRELIRTALAEFEIPFQEKNLRVEICLAEDPVPVECDGDRILQVIGNVLANALKFSPPDGAIQIRLRTGAPTSGDLPDSWRRRGVASGGYAVVSITDSGPGVPDSEKEKIFEKFHQVRAPRGSGPSSPVTKLAGRGVGLGLAIARTIIEAHGGAIWVEDNSGSGSIFHILLPARSAAPRQSVPTTPPL